MMIEPRTSTPRSGRCAGWRSTAACDSYAREVSAPGRKRQTRLIALRVALDVDLIVVIALALVVLGRRRWLKRQAGEFPGAIRVTRGDIDGLGPKWKRGFGRWVRDVLFGREKRTWYEIAAAADRRPSERTSTPYFERSDEAPQDARPSDDAHGGAVVAPSETASGRSGSASRFLPLSSVHPLRADCTVEDAEWTHPSG
jgi:hypothetical protein